MISREAVELALNPHALSVGCRPVRPDARQLEDHVVVIPPPSEAELRAQAEIRVERDAREVLARWLDEHPVNPGREASERMILHHENRIADLVAEVDRLRADRTARGFARAGFPPPLPADAREQMARQRERDRMQPLIEEVGEETF